MFRNQIEQTKEAVKKNKIYIDEKIIQDPISILLETYLADFHFQGTETEEETKGFREAYGDAESLILQTCYVPYDHKQHLNEQEEMQNLINSLRSIEGPIHEIWQELARILKGKMPADISMIEQFEIKKKVVQLQMLNENIKELDTNTLNFFKGVLDQNNPNKWTIVIKTGSVLKRNFINLLKVFINFLEDEQLLMVTKGENTGMQEISEVNSELCSLLTKMYQMIDSVDVNFKTSIHELFQMIKNMKKEIDTLQKILRKKSTMMYTY
jgi:hypothetical protein